MEAKEIAQYADRCIFSVSEDFGAPIGSLVCGSKEFIYELRQTRRLLGGDLRQGGVAAAPAIYALRHNILLLNKDNSDLQDRWLRNDAVNGRAQG